MVAPALTEARHDEEIWRLMLHLSPHILNFGTRWMWVISLTLRPLYIGEVAPSVQYI
jgi:hypothetical protein